MATAHRSWKFTLVMILFCPPFRPWFRICTSPEDSSAWHGCAGTHKYYYFIEKRADAFHDLAGPGSEYAKVQKIPPPGMGVQELTSTTSQRGHTHSQMQQYLPQDNVMKSTDEDFPSQIQETGEELLSSDEELQSSNIELPSTFYNSLSPYDKKRLHKVFENINTRARIDFTNEEIKDIQASVYKLLEGVVERINRRGIFCISRIQLCGSMAEKTSNWKYDARGVYMEFDFLAVLEGFKSILPGNKCPGCIHLMRYPIELKNIRRCYNIQKRPDIYEKNDDCFEFCNIPLLFMYELSWCLVSSCNCFNVLLEDELVSFQPLSPQTECKHRCEKCTVVTPTGTLSVNASSIGVCEYSFDFLWTSKARSLTSYDISLHEPKVIDSLRIQGDFLPTLEIFGQEPDKKECKHECFIVPKHCVLCDSPEWRKSSCMSEINTVLHAMAEKHRKCYRILKYMHGRFFTYFKSSYHIKIAVLNHNKACSNSTEDYEKCLFQILDEYAKCCETGAMRSTFLPLELPIYSEEVEIPSTWIKDLNRSQCLLRWIISEGRLDKGII